MLVLLIVLAVVVGIIVLLAAAVIVSYNRFVRQRNYVRESWRQIDVELQRRHDLIPNLVEIAQGYLTQERTVLKQVTEARGAAMQARRAPQTGPVLIGQAEAALGRQLGGLFAVVESYPDLKSNQTMRDLQHELSETEDRIAAGRRFYNGNVRAINVRVQSFPSSVVASTFHFGLEEFFEVEDEETRAPATVDFSGVNAPPQPPLGPQPAPAPQQPPAPQPPQG